MSNSQMIKYKIPKNNKQIRFDATPQGKGARLFIRLLIQAQKDQIFAGLDNRGRRFRPYRRRYKQEKARDGYHAATVNLRRTGQFVKSIRMLDRVRSTGKDKMSVEIGPRGKRRRRLERTKGGTNFERRGKRKRNAAKFKKNKIGYNLQVGAMLMRHRPYAGLTRASMRKILKKISRSKHFIKGE